MALHCESCISEKAQDTSYKGDKALVPKQLGLASGDRLTS